MSADFDARVLTCAPIDRQFTQQELTALKLLYLLVRRHLGTGGGNTAAKLLLGLYNGTRFPFDLTDLRLLDRGNHAAAMTVIQMDTFRCRAEVHHVLDAIFADGFYTGHEFEQWAHRLKLKGRCSKENLPDAASRRVE